MIELPFPPSSLSGHNNGAWYSKSRVVATHRSWAFHATRAAKLKGLVPAEGDVRIHFRFVPPDRRGDRCNYPNRLKAYIDGIAEALGINDRRFLPSYEFSEPQKPGAVIVHISTVAGLDAPSLCDSPDCIKGGPDAGCNSKSGPDHNRLAVGGD